MRVEGVPELEVTVTITTLLPPWPEQHKLQLVAPAGGLEPGARYRFEYVGPEPSGDAVIVARPRPAQVSVAVSRDFVELEPTEVDVAVESHYGMLDVATSSGSCSAQVEAAQLAVELKFGSELERWRSALLYGAVLDGSEQWVPIATLCSRQRAGRSWVGAGRELLYRTCKGKVYFARREQLGLGGGTHALELVAWLPGTDLVWRRSVPVRLECSSDAG